MKIINQYMSASESAKNDTGELYLYGDIVDNSWWDEDVSPKTVRDALDDFNGAKNLDIHINSYGGSCVAGNAIISILDNYRRKNNATLNVYIEGIAASMGSGIASVGDKVYMADNALLMLHKPLSWACGNADDLRKTIEVLDKTEDALVKNYMRRFNGTEDELRQVMSDETWYTADEAQNVGLVDEIIAGAQIAASAKGIRVGDQMFNQKVSDMIKNKIPSDKIKKEEKPLKYNDELNAFGITEDFFGTLNLESDKVLELANIVKDAVSVDPVTPFIAKENALEALGCEDVTAEEVLNYAKAGMHPVDTTEFENKAKCYDKIVEGAKASALTNAIKAKGDSYNEARVKKFLDVLSYDEIVEQSEEWKAEAAKALNAGNRVSKHEDYEAPKKEENVEDYQVV